MRFVRGVRAMVVRPLHPFINALEHTKVICESGLRSMEVRPLHPSRNDHCTSVTRDSGLRSIVVKLLQS